MHKPVVKFEGAYGRRTARGFEIIFPNIKATPEPLHTHDNERALRYAIADTFDRQCDISFPQRSRTQVHTNDQGDLYSVQTFYGTLLTAYNPHRAICLRPEVLWNLFAHEVGRYVNLHGKECAHLFTKTPETKTTLLIPYEPGEDWCDIVLRYRPLFDGHISPDVLQVLLPRFSTTDTESEVVTLLTFMDTVSQWYDYGMYCCGFPRILLAGTDDDWKLLRRNVYAIGEMIPGLTHYVAALGSVLRRILDTVRNAEVDPEFWGSMFRYESNSSPPELDGWISAFIAFKRKSRGQGIEEADAVLRDPKEFNWEDTWSGYQRPLRFGDAPRGLNFTNFSVERGDGSTGKLVMVSGAIGTEIDGEYLTPRLGFGVGSVQ